MPRRRPKVSRLERRRDVARLVEALRYRDIALDSSMRQIDVGEPVRADAAAALGRLGDPSAIPALGAALSTEVGAVRRSALDALSGFEEPRALDFVIDATLSSATEDPPLHAHMLAILADRARSNGSVAQRAGLRYLEGEAGDDALGASAVGALVGHTPGRAARATILAKAAEQLSSENPRRRIRGSHMLGALPDTSAREVAAVLDRREGHEAARLLGDLRDSSSTPALLAMLRSEDAVTRRSAAEALQLILDPEAVEGLLEAASDADHGVRQAAVDALHALGPVATLSGFAAIARSLLPQLEEERRADGIARLSQGAGYHAQGVRTALDSVNRVPAIPVPVPEAVAHGTGGGDVVADGLVEPSLQHEVVVAPQPPTATARRDRVPRRRKLLRQLKGHRTPIVVLLLVLAAGVAAGWYSQTRSDGKSSGTSVNGVRIQVLSSVLQRSVHRSGRRQHRARLSVRVRVTNNGRQTIPDVKPVLFVGSATARSDPAARRTEGSLVRPVRPKGATAAGLLRFEVMGTMTTRLVSARRAKLRIAGITVSLPVRIGGPPKSGKR